MTDCGTVPEGLYRDDVDLNSVDSDGTVHLIGDPDLTNIPLPIRCLTMRALNYTCIRMGLLSPTMERVEPMVFPPLSLPLGYTLQSVPNIISANCF